VSKWVMHAMAVLLVLATAVVSWAAGTVHVGTPPPDPPMIGVDYSIPQADEVRCGEAHRWRMIGVINGHEAEQAQLEATGSNPDRLYVVESELSLLRRALVGCAGHEPDIHPLY